MKQYVGQTIKVVVQGFPGVIKGKMVKEDPNLVYLKSEVSGEIWRLPKNKICGFSPDKEDESFVPVLILACECSAIGCPGVQYAKEGPGFSAKDIEVFTSGCPMKSDKCRMGSKGELRSLSSDFLKNMMVGMLFGDYPEEKREVKHGGSGRTGKKTQRGSSKGGRSGCSEEQT